MEGYELFSCKTRNLEQKYTTEILKKYNSDLQELVNELDREKNILKS